MGLSESILLQLTLVGLLALVFFLIAYSLPQKVAATALLLLIPFQPIETRFGTANVFLTFVVFIAMLMREKDIRLPMLAQILFVLFACLVSMSQTHPSTHVQHAFYMVYLVSAVLVFWISYDLTLRVPTLSAVLNVFLVMNVLVVIYCIVQLIVGPGDKFRLFGMEEFAMMHVRADYRLTGPFGGAGTIAEYFIIMIYVMIHQVLTTESSNFRRGLIGLIGVNLLLLIATGNRGGFLTLIGSGMLFLWMFRHLLGAARTLRFAIVGTVLLCTAAAITVNYTDFDRLFDRLVGTEIEEGVPDTRAKVWPMAWKAIKERPILGNGPRLRLIGDEDERAYKGHTVIQYPHNLYLFQLFTVGVVGLTAFLIFLATPLFRCWNLSRDKSLDPGTSSFAKTGVLIMIVIFVDQIKVEFMRFSLVDYWHFVFALFGVLIAFCDRASAELRNNTAQTSGSNSINQNSVRRPNASK